MFLFAKGFLFSAENLVKVTGTFTNRERMIFADIFSQESRIAALSLPLDRHPS